MDYHSLNERTVKDNYRISVVDELLNELHGACYFTKIDLCSRYHHMRMHPDDIEKDNLPDAPQPLRISGDALRSHKCTSDVPGLDE